MLIVVVLCVISLYLNQVLLYGFGAMYNIAYIVIYYADHQQYDTTFFMTIELDRYLRASITSGPRSSMLINT